MRLRRSYGRADLCLCKKRTYLYLFVQHGKLGLGHARIDTTTVYAEIDLQRKAKAIMLFDSDEPAPDPSYRDDEGLMAFLQSL